MVFYWITTNVIRIRQDNDNNMMKVIGNSEDYRNSRDYSFS